MGGNGGRMFEVIEREAAGDELEAVVLATLAISIGEVGAFSGGDG